MALEFFEEHECKYLMNISKSLWIKKSKIVDRKHHFVGSRFVAIPFCRPEKTFYRQRG